MICMYSVDKTILILFSILVCVLSDNVQDENKSEKYVTPNDFLRVPHVHFNHRRYHHHHHSGDLPSGFQHTSKFHDGDPNFISSKNEKQNYSITGDDDQKSWNETTKYIPLEFIKIINEHNVSDLLRNYIEYDNEEPAFVANRFGDDARERSESPKDAAKAPKAAGCSPEVQTIQLKNTTDPSILYVPQCTKVERCGGCCTHKLLSCQPTKTEIITYQVLKTQYNGAMKLKLLGKELVSVEKHLSCKCGCKIKEESCNKYQEYRPAECQCVCTNVDEEKKCYKNSNKKLWNPELCACQCRDIFQCSTGQYFDHNECKCLTTTSQRFAAMIFPQDA